MAKSGSYFGLRSGSTKSHTYSVVDGKQITKDRVENVKNPRTFPQMSQRCVVSTIGTAYSAMKSICNHSFEECTAGMQCMRKYFSENLKHIQISREYENGFFGFIKYQQAGLVPGSYIISQGSLPDACPGACILSVNAENKLIVVEVASGNSSSALATALGCRRFDDVCTIALMYPKADGSYGFGAVRFTYKQAATVLDSFPVSFVGDVASVTPTFESNTLKVEVRMMPKLATGATTVNTYLAAIASRKVNGNWLRSNAQFDVTDTTPTFAEAIATYPVGEERFLNGGSLTPDLSPEGEGNQGGSNGGSNTGGSQNGGQNGGGTGTIDTGGGNTGGNGGSTDPDDGDEG